MTDREVCIVPATSAATRSIRRHFRECKAVSVSLIQPCAAKCVKGRRQLRLRQEGSLLHLLIANGTCSLGAASAEGRRWKDGTSSQSIRLPRCPIPCDCCRFCYRFACFWQYRDAYAMLPYALFCCLVRPAAAISITFFISIHFRIIHLPAQPSVS